MKIKYIPLTISLLAFAIGFSDLQENIFFWLARPVGAIAFIVFFILFLLEEDYALFDESEAANENRSLEVDSAKSSNPNPGAPALGVSSLR